MSILGDQLGMMAKADPSLSMMIQVRKGDAVYNHGDPALRLYMVESGQLKTTTYSSDGKQCLLSIHTRGDTFGELSLLGMARRETATAMRDSRLWQINSARFLALLDDRNLTKSFVQSLIARMIDQQQMIVNLVTMDSERRLAATLLHIANKLGERRCDGLRIDVKLTHEDLSNMVGTTRSRVGFFLKGFRESGLVEPRAGSSLLINKAKLIEFIQTGRRGCLDDPNDLRLGARPFWSAARLVEASRDERDARQPAMA